MDSVGGKRPKDTQVLRAIVVGAGRGIGLATADALREGGHDVIAGVRNTRAPAITRWRDSARDAQVLGVDLIDIADPVSVEAFIDRAALKMGGVDTLIVTAGIAYLGGVAAVSPAQFAEMALTNFAGPYFCLHYARRHLAGARGTFLAITSRASRGTYPFSLAYGASKAGASHMLQTAARDLADSGITVLGLSPGAVATDMRSALFPEEDPSKLLQPAEVAEMIMHMLDTKFRAASGTIIDFPW